MRKNAVDGLDLEVIAGEIYGFLGPNGAGKTTTMKLLLGLLQPTAGTIAVFGQPAHGLAHRSRIGYLPESPYFYDYLTGREILDYYGRLCGLPAAVRRERVQRLLSLVDLEGVADLRLRKYSKGMLQRLGMAQALVNEPDLLILDEPQSGLDPAGRKLIRDIILAQRAAGRTVFFSSHILSDAEMICDRVGIMHRGRLVSTGRLEELVRARVHAMEFEADGLRQRARDTLRARARAFLDAGERVQFTIPGGEELVPEILASVAAGGGRLVSLTPIRESLEEIFLREVDGGTEGP
jgi:ABC-2 type transport system ATP-binding protein